MKNTIASPALDLLAAALFLLPVVTQAGILVNQTTGSTIFDDNFENGTVDSLPVATVGTWTSNQPNDDVVLSDDWGGGLGPYAGTKMLGFWSGGGTSVQLTGTGIVANSGNGDVIQMQLAFRIKAGQEVSLYAKSGGTDLLQFGLFGPDMSPGSGYRPNGVSVVNSAGLAWVYTNFTQNPEAWNTLIITHTNGTTDWAISVNGGTAFNTTGYAAGTGNSWYGFMLKNDAIDATAYFDAVPEPAALALLGLAGLFLAGRRQRR